VTIDQMSDALKSVGAVFAVTSAKTVLPNDPSGSKPSYHIHPDASYPHEKDIERVYSQAQFRDWVRTMKAAKRSTDNAQAFMLWQVYKDRWS